VHQFPPNVGTFCQTIRCYTADISLREHLKSQTLSFILLMCTFGRVPYNASKWEMGFNSVA
jgi:hypothetical protein